MYLYNYTSTSFHCSMFRSENTFPVCDWLSPDRMIAFQGILPYMALTWMCDGPSLETQRQIVGAKGKSKWASPTFFFCRLFRLSIAPTICPWVSKDACSQIRYGFQPGFFVLNGVSESHHFFNVKQGILTFKLKKVIHLNLWKHHKKPHFYHFHFCWRWLGLVQHWCLS